MSDLTEKYLSGERVFEGKLLKIDCDTVLLPDGKESKREYVRHPGACVVVAEVRPGVLIFERQFRYPLRRSFIELPAGKLDPNEEPLTCAKRELLEETGYSASEWTHLGVMHPCIGYSDERIEIFLARGLVKGEQKLDEGEFLEVFEMTLEEAHRAVLAQKITDGKSVTALYLAREVLLGK